MSNIKSKTGTENSQSKQIMFLEEDTQKINQPLCILDIRYGKDGCSFEFIVSLYRMHGNSKMDVAVHDLEILTEEYRIWLLSKFKQNLRGLTLIDRMKTWVLNRLDILKDYCEQHDISFEVLNIRNNLPPNQVFNGVNLKSHNSLCDDQIKSKTSELGKYEVFNNNKKCLSVKEKSPGDSLRFILSKAQRMKAITNQFKIMMLKYRNSTVVDKDELLDELDRVKAHVHDF